MSLVKVRLKILRKIAQQTGATTTTPAATTTTPTAAASIPVAPTIRASEAYPTIRNVFDAARVQIIDTLVNQLNVAANIATSGKYNLQVLRNQNFAFDPSSFSSPDQKNLMGFFLKVCKTLLGGGAVMTQPIQAAQLNTWVQYLLQSPELANLSEIDPTGPIAQKVSPNLKNNIRELVARLQPTVTTRRA